MTLAQRYRVGLILVTGNRTFAEFIQHYNRQPWNDAGFPRNFYVLWRKTPVVPAALLSWRDGLIDHAKSAPQRFRARFASIGQDPTTLQPRLEAQLTHWPGEPPAPEPEALRRGYYVHIDGKQLINRDPGWLTICPDSRLNDCFAQLDEARFDYAQLIGSEVDERRKRIQKQLAPLLQADRLAGEDATRLAEAIEKEFDLQANLAVLPRVLLLGDSGTGKTLVARYLARRSSAPAGESSSRPFVRVPLPDYSGETDRLEYDLYGYRAGTYTGASESGSFGYFLEHLGGTIFFDEIGDASPTAQTKLLAFLDDYRVRPRGWTGPALLCPMLIVAATNRPLADWADSDDPAQRQTAFRNDLFQRFNVVIHVPDLNARREELPYILDAMLQNEAFNPGLAIQAIGEQALQCLQEMDFEKKNFRLLERLVREACLQATGQGRDYLTKQDVLVQ
ncbi:sigma 54-interacting transcriptional regulator [Thiorhodovibrio frisius]|nr:sigma 54-interacting transcriptional regulator [Thiorhodovibrio frisius]